MKYFFGGDNGVQLFVVAGTLDDKLNKVIEAFDFPTQAGGTFLSELYQRETDINNLYVTLSSGSNYYAVTFVTEKEYQTLREIAELQPKVNRYNLLLNKGTVRFMTYRFRYTNDRQDYCFDRQSEGALAAQKRWFKSKFQNAALEECSIKQEPTLINISVIKGTCGTIALYIDNHRVTGGKPYGLGKTIKEWNVEKDEFLEYVKMLN